MTGPAPVLPDMSDPDAQGVDSNRLESPPSHETGVGGAGAGDGRPVEASGEGVNPSFDLAERLTTYRDRAEVWLTENVLTRDTLFALSVQILVIMAAVFLGWLLAPRVRRWIDLAIAQLPEGARERTHVLASMVLDHGLRPVLWVAFIWIGQIVLAGLGQPHVLVRIAASLATAWLVIKLITQFMPEDLRQPIAWFAWLLAILSAFGILDDIWRVMNSRGVAFGDAEITVEFVLRAIIMAAVFIFVAQWLSRRLKARVETLPKVEPSLRILMSNAIQIGLFIAAAFLTLASLDVPLSGLAVFGGALGVGLGFGMQQIVANFISGVILLSDRSIKPHDVIEVDETYGEVMSLGLRYASVVTRDGKEHLIPNEQLVTNKVVNWSYSNNLVRIKRRFLVEYESDLRLAAQLCIEAALDQPRILEDPAPKCLLMEFGEHAVEMEARFWITDPQNGINNIGSEVMFAMWDKFREHGIDLPLGQDEIRIMGDSQLNVKLVDDEAKGPKS